MTSGASIIQVSINSIDEVDAIEKIMNNTPLLRTAIQYAEKQMNILVNGAKRKSKIVFTTDK